MKYLQDHSTKCRDSLRHRQCSRFHHSGEVILLVAAKKKQTNHAGKLYALELACLVCYSKVWRHFERALNCRNSFLPLQLASKGKGLVA